MRVPLQVTNKITKIKSIKSKRTEKIKLIVNYNYIRLAQTKESVLEWYNTSKKSKMEPKI